MEHPQHCRRLLRLAMIRHADAGATLTTKGCFSIDSAALSFLAGYLQHYKEPLAHVSGAAFPLAKAFAQVPWRRKMDMGRAPAQSSAACAEC